MARMRVAVAIVVALATLVPAVGTVAAPRVALAQLLERDAASLEDAAAAAASGDQAAVQARYEIARSLQTALAGTTTPTCRALQQRLSGFAAAHVRAAEAFDRLRPARIARHDADARSALAQARVARTACPVGRLLASPASRHLRAAEQRAAAVLARTKPPRTPRLDPTLTARLETALRGFDGHAAAWVHDLTSGRAAGVAADDRYPAASTVKLGLLVAALSRFGVAQGIAHDLRTMSSWSSNLAANRLRNLVGGDATIETTLRRLGARASTYTGQYRAGTVRGAPPVVSARVTTARDLGTVLAALHGAALGGPAQLRSTRLTAREARVALGLLLAADDTEGALVADVPAARKHGWLSAARHTAAILYGPRGPVVAVLLTYRDGLTAKEAQRLGRRVARVALA